MNQPQTWDTYEEVAQQILNDLASEFGLVRVEPKQGVPGKRSGTTWTIDAKGIKVGEEGFVIVECRRYTSSKQKQEQMGGLAYRIIDAQAAGGIIVSPLGLQKGAKLIADAENIINIQLAENATPADFTLQFLNKIFIHMTEKVTCTDTFSVSVKRRCKSCGELFAVPDEETKSPPDRRREKQTTCEECRKQS